MSQTIIEILDQARIRVEEQVNINQEEVIELETTLKQVQADLGVAKADLDAALSEIADLKEQLEDRGKQEMKRAIAFDGSYFGSFEESVKLTGDFTIETWVKVLASDTDKATDVAILTGDEGATSTEGRPKFGFDLKKLQPRFRVDGTPFLFSGSDSDFRSWTHLAFVRKGSKLIAYKNGLKLQQEREFAGLVELQHIGKGWKGRHANLELDDLRIWSEARTEVQIKQDGMNQLADPSTETRLLLNYIFDEREDSLILTDVSKKKNKANLSQGKINAVDLPGAQPVKSPCEDTEFPDLEKIMSEMKRLSFIN